MGRTGVLLLGFGGPDSLDAVEPFMCNLMGRQPSEELVQRVCRRYLTIGGQSPLTGIALDIANGLESRLVNNGAAMPVRVGMAYWNPFIGDALAELKAEGCDRVITLSLSPFESKVTTGVYRDAVTAAAEQLGGVEIIEAPFASKLDAYVDYFAGATAVALEDLEPNEGAIIVFTAHSLPESDLVENDPYVGGLRDVAEAVAGKLGLDPGQDTAFDPVLPGVTAFGSTSAPRAWLLAYQSKGARPGEWLGPELDAVIAAASRSQVGALVVVPIGFLLDHMETLFDLDVDAAGAALDADLGWARVPVPNSHPMMLDALADAIRQLL